MRTAILTISTFTLSLAFQLSMAKYGADVPDAWLLVLWLLPLAPLIWWLCTHEKLLSRREQLKRSFQQNPVVTSFVTIATLLIVVSCMAGVSYTGWRMLRIRHESSAHGTDTKTPQKSTVPQSSENEKPQVPAHGITPKQHMTVLGKDSTVIGQLPIGSQIGDGSTYVGATDDERNTILNRGGTAIGHGAKADPTSIAIGAGASAGTTTTSSPRILQQNSGGINVQQATTGENSPIINSPVTIGNVPKHISTQDRLELGAFLANGKRFAEGVQIEISADQYSSPSPFPAEFYNLLNNATWSMRGPQVETFFSSSPHYRPDFKGAIIRSNGSDKDGAVLVNDPLFYIANTLTRLHVPIVLDRNPGKEKGLIAVVFEGGFPD
jgi:hypothetical protein